MASAPSYNHGAAFPEELRSWQSRLREDFPIITAHPDQVYLDNAATSQKPRAVLDAVTDYLTSENANAGRGTYPWANRTTALIRHTEQQVRRFLDDPEPERSGVHFVSGTTEGLRLIARDWLARQLRDGDEIVVPDADHSANALPWREAVDEVAREGITVRVRPMPYDPAHDYDHRALLPMVNERTRFIATTHVHHVYGGDMNVGRIRAAAGPDVVICLDAAQSVGHLPLSVADLDVDFVVFSGHKAMALPGTGVIWARNERGPRFVPGGWAGSPNTSGIVSLSAAMSWLQEAGLERIARWTVALAARLTDGLRHLRSYEVLGCQRSLAADSPVQQRHGIVTFRHHRIGSNDLGFILAAEGFMVRADGHCQAAGGETTSSVRVSVHAYNTVEEIDCLLGLLERLDEEGGPSRRY
ncbi:cysteine desulfurase [Actinoplanes philippinensis]|uniref:Cysteine desulfurase / selenocysteine lyase n=1 Tax=Actinoplanes philippinensis TaxID=35752 RepID=A0A1I2KJS1_9ACTN|nr:aminotransferase class V-fold PLP-dependent enzyme [Actinoplanes philippinensis]GIE82020.1 cysteine desulfurase [Actinoplanes philippinensis]SFF65507.1 cysteine desulfurase / selenocysteine lyase [Actinoplanes philippinensis]